MAMTKRELASENEQLRNLNEELRSELHAEKNFVALLTDAFQDLKEKLVEYETELSRQSPVADELERLQRGSM
tara:strand:- start:12833 stop:13051 length:219 start_codon:yes stop_codon:yes gene_type:complete